METRERLVLILPHPDDEVFCLHVLKLFPDHQKTFVYLTNGSPTDNIEKIKVREAECLKAISLISENAEIFLYGSLEELTDGMLARKFSEEDFQALNEFISRGSVPNVFISPTLEGGHQDHDAAFIITKKFCHYWKADHYTFPMYSSSFFPFPFFRTMKSFEGYKRYQQSLTSRLYFLLTVLKLISIYRSQSKTWLGLILQMLFRYMVTSPFYAINQSRDMTQIGKFLYESRGNESREALIDFQEEFSIKN